MTEIEKKAKEILRNKYADYDRNCWHYTGELLDLIEIAEFARQLDSTKEEQPMTDVEKIVKIIAELKINESNMCSKVGIKFSTWWRIKNGKSKNPSYDTIVKLMTYVGSLK